MKKFPKNATKNTSVYQKTLGFELKMPCDMNFQGDH